MYKGDEGGGGSKNWGAYLLTVYVLYGWPPICHGKFKKNLISFLTLKYMYYIVDVSNKEMFQLDSSLKLMNVFQNPLIHGVNQKLKIAKIN